LVTQRDKKQSLLLLLWFFCNLVEGAAAPVETEMINSLAIKAQESSVLPGDLPLNFPSPRRAKSSN
jgi:hypothetical protein